MAYLCVSMSTVMIAAVYLQNVFVVVNGLNWAMDSGFQFPYGARIQIYGVFNQTLYTFGGQDEDSYVQDIYKWNYNQPTIWTKLSIQTPTTTFQGGYSHSQTVIGNYLYMFGPWDDITNTKIYMFDFVNEEFIDHTIPDMPNPQSRPCVVNDGSKNIYLMRSTTLQVYNITNNSWSFGAPIPLTDGVRSASCAYYNGFIYLFGGSTDETSATYIYNIIRYKIKTNEWQQTAETMPVTTTRCRAILGNDDIIYIAGCKESPSVLSFDPETWTITQEESTTYTRGWSDVFMINNQLFVAVGWEEADSAFYYDSFYEFAEVTQLPTKEPTASPVTPTNDPTLRSPTSNPTTTPSMDESTVISISTSEGCSDIIVHKYEGNGDSLMYIFVIICLVLVIICCGGCVLWLFIQRRSNQSNSDSKNDAYMIPGYVKSLEMQKSRVPSQSNVSNISDNVALKEAAIASVHTNEGINIEDEDDDDDDDNEMRTNAFNAFEE